MPTIRLVDPDGVIRDVDESVASAAVNAGWKPPTPEQDIAHNVEQAKQAEYGGVGGAIKAGLAAGARGATLGLSDVAARAFGGEQARIDLEGLREQHPAISTGGEFAGAIAPAIISGGAATPAGLAGRLGARVSAVGAEAGALGKIGASALGGAAEGALFGAGTGVSELALSDDPLTVEHVASSLSSHALYGAGLGGALGGAGKAAELGLERAREAVKAATDRLAARRVTRVAHEATPGAPTEPEPPTTPAGFDLSAKADGNPVFDEGAVLKRGLPDPASLSRETYRAEAYVLKPSDLLGRDLRGIESGDMLTSPRTTGIQKAWKDGEAVPGIEIDVDPAGRYFVADGNHRLLAAAIDGDRPVLARFRPVEAEVGGMDPLEEMLSTALGGAERSTQSPSAAPSRPVARDPRVEHALETGDLEGVSPQLLRDAAAEEHAAILETRAPERQAFVDELRAARDADLAEQPWNYGRGHKDPYVKGLTGDYRQADQKIRALLRNEKGLAEKPQVALDALQRQQQALDALYEAAQEEERMLWKAFEEGPRKIREEILSNVVDGKFRKDPLKTEAWKAGVRGPFTDAGLESAVEKEMARRFPRDPSGDLIYPKHLEYKGDLVSAQVRNENLQELLGKITRDIESPRLTKLEQAMEAIGVPKEPSLGQAVFGAVAPFAGPLGVAAAAGNRVLGNFRKVAAAAGVRAGRAATAFLGAAVPVTRKATPLATKALASLRYGDDEKAKRPKSQSLPDLFEARSSEVKEQVQIAPDGSFRMRPEARQKLATRFDGIRAADPRLADQLETAGARRIAYLASILPRLPDYGMMPTGPRNGAIPELAMRAWARAASALEDPDAVFERAAHGEVLPEEAAALRAVVPGKLDDFTRQVLEGLPGRTKALPYSKRLALSILTGTPIDPAMHPAVLSILQGQFTNDEGQPATQAPSAAPQFGSIQKSVSDPTPAQRRSQGAHV